MDWTGQSRTNSVAPYSLDVGLDLRPNSRRLGNDNQTDSIAPYSSDIFTFLPATIIKYRITSSESLLLIGDLKRYARYSLLERAAITS